MNQSSEDGACTPTRDQGKRRRLRAVVRTLVLCTALAASSGFLAWMVAFPGESFRSEPAPLDAGEIRRIRAHVTALASNIGPRNITAPGSLEASADYIRNQFAAMGYEVTSERFMAGPAEVENLYVEIPGASNHLVLLGAHYDTHPGSPGADDNASGVAALLELARTLRTSRPHRTIRLVAFVNEEYPFARTQWMGSWVHARAARTRGEEITAMISIESIGNFSDAPQSQSAPAFLAPFYPDEGDFVAFMGDLSSRRDVTAALSAFRGAGAQIPSEGLSAPGWLAGTYRSDHWSFWQEGYPGIMVTDTAPYRYGAYHQPSDTADTLEYPRLVRTVRGLHQMTLRLASDH